MPLRLYRRTSLGSRFWLGLGKGGPSIGRRGKRVSLVAGRRGVGGSIRVAKGLSYLVRRR